MRGAAPQRAVGHVLGELVQGQIEPLVAAGGDDRAVRAVSHRPPAAGKVHPVGAEVAFTSLGLDDDQTQELISRMVDEAAVEGPVRFLPGVELILLADDSHVVE